MKRTKEETKAILKEASHLRRLLKENGLILGGFGNGVMAYRKTGAKDFEGRDVFYSLDFGKPEWSWIEPLLLELRKLRKLTKRHH